MVEYNSSRVISGKIINCYTRGNKNVVSSPLKRKIVMHSGRNLDQAEVSPQALRTLEDCTLVRRDRLVILIDICRVKCFHHLLILLGMLLYVGAGAILTYDA